jgi:hypothetical protein
MIVISSCPSHLIISHPISGFLSSILSFPGLERLFALFVFFYFFVFRFDGEYENRIKTRSASDEQWQ